MFTVKDAARLNQLAAASIAGVFVFVLRGLLVLTSLGEFGDYRGAALGEIAAQPVSCAGREVCGGCPTHWRSQKHRPAVLCFRYHDAICFKPIDFRQMQSINKASGLMMNVSPSARRLRIIAASL
jgi:hypothetical protein